MLGSTNTSKPSRPGRKRNRFALAFDGDNDYIKYPVDGSGHSLVVGRMMGQKHTHIFWIKPTDFNAERPLLNIGNEAGYQFTLYIDTSGYINLNCSTDGNSCIRTSETGLVAGEWKQVALVFDGTQSTANDRIKFYINGADAGIGGTTGTPPTVMQVSSDDDNTTSNAVAYLGYRDMGSGVDNTMFKGLINSYAYFYQDLSRTAIVGLCDIPVNGYLRGYDVYDPSIDYTHANMDVSWLQMGDGTERGVGTYLYNMALSWSGTSQADWSYGADISGASYVHTSDDADNAPQADDD